MVAAVGALVSFAEGSQLLQELAGVPVNAKQVERAAEALGGEIAEDEKLDVTPVSTLPLPATLYPGVDGTAIPMRAEELRGRRGKQTNGSSKTREVKLCTVWSAEARDAEDRPMRDEGSVTYSAAIKSAATLNTDPAPSAFTQRVLREASRRQFTAAQRTVVIGDGAPWTWNIAQELFPRAIQIVDRFHVQQTLSTVAKALYGSTSPKAHQWAGRRHDELDTGKFSELLRHFRRGQEMFSIPPPQPRPHALSPLPGPGAVHLQRCCGSGLPSDHRHPPQARRHALDRARLQRHHRTALLPPQRALPRFLGTPQRCQQGRVTLLHLIFSSCADR